MDNRISCSPERNIEYAPLSTLILRGPWLVVEGGGGFFLLDTYKCVKVDWIWGRGGGSEIAALALKLT